jgi:hypothetical protein
LEARSDIDTTAALIRADGSSPWGSEACQTVQTALAVLVRSVIEHTTGVALLLQNGGFTIAMDALTRAALEAGTQAAWLAEPGIGGAARVARLYVLRRQTAAQFEVTAARMNIPLTAGYTHTVADIDALYRDDLGIMPTTGPNGGFTGAAGQPAQKYAKRVAWFIRSIGHDPAEGPYAFYCGASHGELWRIVQAYTANPADGTLVPTAAPELVRAALSVCVDTLAYSCGSAFGWLGRRASVNEFMRHDVDLRAALRATWTP